jgi:hypothetical protein
MAFKIGIPVAGDEHENDVDRDSRQESLPSPKGDPVFRFSSHRRVDKHLAVRLRRR